MTVAAENPDLVDSALRALGIERLMLAIHDASFPGLPEEDLGRGSPASYGGRELLRFVRELGFSGVQLGPRGKTSLANPSPYDGSIFARSTLSIALGPLAFDDRWGDLVPRATLEAAVVRTPKEAATRVPYVRAWHQHHQVLQAAFERFRTGSHPQLAAEMAAFEHANTWLEADGLFEVLALRHGTDDWRRWPTDGEDALDRRLLCPPPAEETACALRRARLTSEHAEDIARNTFFQFLAHAQHRSLRQGLRELGLSLYGDLQVGVSLRDHWQHQDLFLDDYLLGAPPSRTNAAGQAWGYPVLDPRLRHRARPGQPEGAALQFMRARFDKLFHECDGVRIDHPHGLVCPWVYRADDGDPLRAVRQGARLLASPDLPDHPALAPFAIVGRAHLAPGDHPRHADDWVRWLTPEQLDRYAVVFDVLGETALAHGRGGEDIACEVLSTCPLPLAEVLARHGLGRFRVSQKADPSKPRDPYRTAHAAPADWVMLGTHDTPSLWAAVELWTEGRRTDMAAYLAERLEPEPAVRPRWAAALAADRRQLCQAMLADLFVGPARRVSIFFTDLFGMSETYNRPGIVDDSNWTLRVPPDYRSLYKERLARGEALDLPAALATALRARYGQDDRHAELRERLQRRRA